MDKYRVQKLAQLISLIFGIPWIIVIVFTLLTQTGLHDSQVALFALVFPILHFAIPMSYFMYAMRKGEISDIDITKREERYKILSVVFAKNVVSLGFVWYFGNALLLQLTLAIFLAFTAVYAITFAWKISLHMTFNTAGLVLLNSVHNWEYIYLFVLLIPVYWSRHVLQKHTHAQLVAGFVIPLGIMLSVL